MCDIFAAKVCRVSGDCECGEVCFKNFDNNQYCGSKQVVQDTGVPFSGDSSGNGGNSSGSTSTSCIAANSLKGVAQNDLMYKHHQLANVLCDECKNCDTPGHMVMHEIMPMMMSKYCEEVGFEKKIMLVNSRKLGRKV